MPLNQSLTGHSQRFGAPTGQPGIGGRAFKWAYLEHSSICDSRHIGRIRHLARPRYLLIALAVVWLGLMRLSRMVLGAHWPTDVLAAICLGVFVPLAISVALDLHQYRRSVS